MRHQATSKFWAGFELLPKSVQKVARKNFILLRTNPKHTSLKFKKVGRFFSVRIGISHRAVAVGGPEGPVWFWIGHHAEYERIIAT